VESTSIPKATWAHFLLFARASTFQLCHGFDNIHRLFNYASYHLEACKLFCFAAGDDFSIDSRLLTHHEDSGLYVFVVTSASSLRERFLYLFSGMLTLDGDSSTELTSF
jgi:hypothetical protein